MNVFSMNLFSMDVFSLDLTIFLIATFAGALVAGLSGFAFGLVAASLWLYILTPLQTATLIVGFGLIVQGYSVWKLKHALDWRRLWPFLAGAIIGVPVGISILGWANPRSSRRDRRSSRALQPLRTRWSEDGARNRRWRNR
jgi:uncharacterized protein